jgi:hypothetical protein
MMYNIILLMCFYFAWIGLNTFFSDYIKNAISHPKYSIPIIDGSFDIYSTLILFVGLPLLLFRKQLKIRRIKEFYEYLNMRTYEFVSFHYGENITNEDKEIIKRMLKLEEINKKIKKRKSSFKIIK